MDLMGRPNIYLDKAAFEQGLYFLQNGGDFADGIIAYQATKFDNAKLLTFDKQAQKLAKTLTVSIEIPTTPTQ